MNYIGGTVRIGTKIAMKILFRERNISRWKPHKNTIWTVKKRKKEKEEEIPAGTDIKKGKWPMLSPFKCDNFIC